MLNENLGPLASKKATQSSLATRFCLFLTTMTPPALNWACQPAAGLTQHCKGNKQAVERPDNLGRSRTGSSISAFFLFLRLLPKITAMVCCKRLPFQVTIKENIPMLFSQFSFSRYKLLSEQLAERRKRFLWCVLFIYLFFLWDLVWISVCP